MNLEAFQSAEKWEKVSKDLCGAVLPNLLVLTAFQDMSDMAYLWPLVPCSKTELSESECKSDACSWMRVNAKSKQAPLIQRIPDWGNVSVVLKHCEFQKLSLYCFAFEHFDNLVHVVLQEDPDYWVFRFKFCFVLVSARQMHPLTASCVNAPWEVSLHRVEVGEEIGMHVLQIKHCSSSYFFRNIISNLKAFLNSLGKHFTTSSRQGNLGVAQKNTSALWPAALADFAGFANWRSLRTDGRPKWSCRRARRKKTQCFGWGRWGSSSPGLYGNAWKKTSDSWAVEQLKLPGDIQRLLVICRVAHLRGNLHHLCIVTSATGRWRRPLLWRILHRFSRRPLDSSRFRPFPSCLWTEDEPLQGFIRQRGESDACLNRLLYEKGMLTFSKWGWNLIKNWGLGSWVVG